MTLDQRIKDVQIAAAALSEVSAAGLNEPTSHGKAGSSEPTMAGRSTLDKVQDMLSRAGSPQERLRAVQRAEGMVASQKRQKPIEESSDQKEFWKRRQVLDKEGQHYEDVAFNLGLDAKFVWKTRSRNELEPRYGRPKGEKAA